MAKKRKTEKPHRELTKRQLSHWQQQQKKQRITQYAGIIIIAAVLVIVALGWYLGLHRPMQQTVIRVNDREFNMQYYVDMLKIQGDTQSAESMTYVTGTVVRNIEQVELIRLGAMELGVSVSDDEVKQELENSGLSDDPVNFDLTRYQILINKLIYGHFDEEVPSSAAQVHMMAMMLESESQALEVAGRIASGEDFGAIAGELSLDAFSQYSDGDLGWHPESILRDYYGITAVPVDYAFDAEAGVLSPPLYDAEATKPAGYWLIKVVSRGVDEEEGDANIHAMLLGSEKEAQEIRARLEAGEDFATLAVAFSQLEGVRENEGNLGMVGEGKYSAVFDEFAFNTEIALGTLSEPIRDETESTSGAYWLVKLLDKNDDREIDKDDRDILKNKAINEWVSALWNDPKYEVDDSLLDDAKVQWAVEQALKD